MNYRDVWGCRELSDLVRFGVSMNPELLRRFDEVISRKGYTNRSEALRDIIRNVLVEEEWRSGDNEVAGTITLVYDHHVTGLASVLNELQHEYHLAIVSTLHVHLDHDNCLEVLVLRCKSSEARRIADRLISVKGVKHGKLTLASTGRSLP